MVSDAKLQVARWQLSGPAFNSYSESTDYLSVDYTINVDTRFADGPVLGPLRNDISLSGAGGTPTTVSVIESSKDANASGHKFVYFARGDRLCKVRPSSWNVENATTTAEAITDIRYTKNAAGTKEISAMMAGSVMEVVTTCADGGGTDTTTVVSTTTARVGNYGFPKDRIFLGNGQAINQVVLSGSVTMAAPVVTTITTVADAVTFTSIERDGDDMIFGTNRGPFFLDTVLNQYRAIVPGMDADNDNCRGMKEWPYLGIIIPLAYGARYYRQGAGRSIDSGNVNFPRNTSPVMGGWSAFDFNSNTSWAYCVVYNSVTTDSYLCAVTTSKPNILPLDYYPIAKFTATQCKALKFIGTELLTTNPTLVGGYGTDAFYMTLGRLQREIDDTNYRYEASGTLYGTEWRVPEGYEADVEFIEFETASCATGKTIAASISFDGQTAVTYGAAVNSSSYPNARVRLYPPSQQKGSRIKPQWDYATDASTTSPQIKNGVAYLGYKLRPKAIDGRTLEGLR